MKRTIILLTGLLSFLSSYGQTGFGSYNLDSINLRFYEDQYLLPEIMNECVEISLDILPYTNRTSPPAGTWNRGYLNLYTGFDFIRSTVGIDNYTSKNVIEDYAQPYYTDTTITVIGISGYESNFNLAYSEPNYDKNYRFSFELRDSSLNNIIRSVDVTDTFDVFTSRSTTRIYKERFLIRQ